MNEKNGLPEGWVTASLESVAVSIVGGGTPPRQEASNFGGDIVWFTPTEIPKSGVAVVADSRERLTDKGLASSSARWIPENSVLLTSRASIGFVAIAGTKLTTNQGFASFILPRGIEPRFLAWWLKYQKGTLEQLAGGTTFKEISKGALREVEAPVPPTNEQRRIVAAIEEQFSRLDAGVASLERARANLKRYRTAVLKAAVEGRLTEAWRGENPDAEPASELLDRILEERCRRWEEDQLASFEKKGKKPPKNWQAKYKKPTAPETDDLPELPEGWIWASVEQLTASVKNGLSQKPAAAPPGHRILRISAVRPMKVDLEDVRFLDLPKEKMESFFLDRDDLLFTRYNGSLSLLGVVGRVGSVLEPTLHLDKLVRVKVVPDGAYAAYLELACNVGASRRHVERRARTTAGQTGVSGTDIKQTPVPVPSRAEQEQIVEEIERRLSILREVETEVEADLKRAARLRQSILKRAFEGRLVEQDPSDEPAGELLARIRAERERNKPEKRRGKKPTRGDSGEAQASLFSDAGD